VGHILFSFVKRRVGVKDFPALIPGHGGACDRIDNLIVAAPVRSRTRALLIRCGDGQKIR